MSRGILRAIVSIVTGGFLVLTGAIYLSNNSRPSAAEAEGQLAQISTTLELISDNVASNVIHGWQTNRLIRYHGMYYASGVLPNPGEEYFWDRKGVFYRRKHDGSWAVAGHLPSNPYTMLVGPDGRFWAVAPSSYENCHVYRMKHPLDFHSFEEVYNGTCSYLGASVSPEGNFLILHAERSDFQAFNPNAVIAAFYDHETGKWYKSRLVTPEGRYGYEGIILRGRKALAVLNSAIADPKAVPKPPHYSWRHVRLALCEDLTKGEWVNKPWLMPEYGDTFLQDLIAGPDGDAYLAYGYREASSLEELAKTPMRHYIAHIRWDLSVDIYPTGVPAGPTKLLVDSRGDWYLLGRVRAGEPLHLWRLDPKAGFKAVEEYELPGTEKLQGYVLDVLNPVRFGGEGDGDTVHVLSAFYPKGSERVQLWHAYFDLPVKERQE